MSYFKNSIEHQLSTGVYNLTIVNSMWHYIETEEVKIIDLTLYHDRLKSDIIRHKLPMFDLDLECTIILETIMLAKTDSLVNVSLDFILDELDSIYNQDNLLTTHLLPYLQGEEFASILHAMDIYLQTATYMPYNWLTSTVLAMKEVILDESI